MKKYLSTTKVSSRRTSSRRPVYIISGLLGTGLLFFWLLPQVLGMLAAIVFVPFNYVESWFMESSSAVPLYLRDKASLIERQQQLEHQLAEQTVLADSVAVLETENDLLKALITKEEDRIIAGVTMRPGDLPYDVFLIDKGRESGIQVGAPVYIGKDQAIGFVAKTYSGMSLVSLATSPGYESVVYIYGPDIYTTAVGEGGGVLRVSVPQGIPMEVGDEVILPSFKSGIFGSITYIETIPSQPEQSGYVSVNIPLNSVRFVSVGTEGMSEISFEEAKQVVNNVRQDLLSVSVPEGILIDKATSSPATTTATTTESDNEIEP